MKKAWLFLLVLVLLLSELVLKINASMGFLLYIGLITGVLLALHKAESLDNNGKLMVILLILPIIRISEVFLDFSYLWRTLIVYYALLFLACFYCFRFRINPGYTRRNLALLPLVILLGIVLGVLGNFLLDFGKNIGVLALIPAIAFSEEILFRGLIQKLIKTEHSAFFSILLTAIIYSIFSLSFGFPAVLFVFIVSLIISLVYNFTENIFLAIAINMLVQAFVFVLPKIHLG